MFDSWGKFHLQRINGSSSMLLPWSFWDFSHHVGQVDLRLCPRWQVDMVDIPMLGGFGFFRFFGYIYRYHRLTKKNNMFLDLVWEGLLVFWLLGILTPKKTLDAFCTTKNLKIGPQVFLHQLWTFCLRVPAVGDEDIYFVTLLCGWVRDLPIGACGKSGNIWYNLI